MANTIIKDPVLLPYYISKDQYCYTVIEIITPDEKNLGRFGNKGNQNEGKDYGKTKKSDAILEDDIMEGKQEKYEDPSKPPEWLLDKKMLDPGLPSTPPPPPTMMLPPPEYVSP